jgi:hypothetical protein
MDYQALWLFMADPASIGFLNRRSEVRILSGTPKSAVVVSGENPRKVMSAAVSVRRRRHLERVDHAAEPGCRSLTRSLMLGWRVMVVLTFVPRGDVAVPEVYICVRLGRMPAGGIVSWVL